MIRPMLLFLALFASLLAMSDAAEPTQVFKVTQTDSTAFLIDGVANAGVSVQAGKTYVFMVSVSSSHPFLLNTIATTGASNMQTAGVTNNRITSGNVTWAVPLEQTADIFYNCENHSAMTGRVSVTAEPDFAQVFDVTNSGSTAYMIDTNSQPTLTLVPGKIYIFRVAAAGHPLTLTSTRGTGTASLLGTTDGVENNNVATGDIVYRVPAAQTADVFYNCAIHAAMGGSLEWDPPTVYSVVNVGSTSYTINSVTGNPSMALTPGNRYIFRVAAAGHPFTITSSPGTGTASLLGTADGVVNNNVATGDVTFDVPSDQTTTLYYNCALHSAMTGKLTFGSTSSSSDDFPTAAVVGGVIAGIIVVIALVLLCKKKGNSKSNAVGAAETQPMNP